MNNDQFAVFVFRNFRTDFWYMESFLRRKVSNAEHAVTAPILTVTFMYETFGVKIAIRERFVSEASGGATSDIVKLWYFSLLQLALYGSLFSCFLSV